MLDAKSIAVCGIVIACIACVPPARAGDGSAPGAVAIVTDIAGTTRATHAGRTSVLEILDTLDAGDRLLLESGASVEIVFPGEAGTVLSVTGPARIAIGHDGASCASSHCRIERRDLFGTWSTVLVHPEAVGRASVSLRGTPADWIELQEPIGALRPGELASMRWIAPALCSVEHCHYSIRIIDERGTVLWSGDTDETSFPVPAAFRERHAPPQVLQHLLWTVAATSGDRQRAEGAVEFRLLGEDEEGQIDRMRASAEGARQSGATVVAEDVLFAMALDEAQMQAEAASHWRALARLRPALRELAAAER